MILSMLFVREMTFLAAGVVMIFMAFKLFMEGVKDGGAEEISVGKWVQVKGGGPGIAFAALGAGIVIHTISTGRMSPEQLQTLVDCEAALTAPPPGLEGADPKKDEE